ncbi:class I SAM-dependent methyltransferase [Alkaliphilus peptidifermentans]|uniref:Methyltransferase domain-containing protein n=1 Tax=Alkaliphilus peptidifermentans DSM 18978 TaxID=1120976 RepID=A0A1G5EJF7_9FIRM|nr:SAM-dependent methyltransferase [Alkaliphilus peptidifermentans]SCY27139.1 Methyltransferase domain-containing protein [Alkaliphilus peptidifermentans DSM 18978]
MKKQIISKLNLFLKGLEDRLKENYLSFIKIEFTCVSGLKPFSGTVLPKDEEIAIGFNGVTREIGIIDFAQEICNIAEGYDELQLIYQERGTNIIINADNKNVRIKYEDKQVKETIEHQGTAQIGNRDYYIKVGPANPLLMEIGILSKQGKIKNDMIRKYNQIDHFVELIVDLLRELEDIDEITILDCGCGKSYLSFVLNYYITEVLKKKCYFIGLDYSENVIESSINMAKNLGYKNMSFYKEDIKNYIPDRDIHMVISLHACDTATDMALALGVRSNARTIVSVPCCQKEILSQYSYEPFHAILKHGILKARMADIITDGLRAQLLEAKGYKVSLVEYISPLETPKNLLLRAVKGSHGNKAAMDQYQELKEALKVDPEFERLIY